MPKRPSKTKSRKNIKVPKTIADRVARLQRPKDYPNGLGSVIASSRAERPVSLDGTRQPLFRVFLDNPDTLIVDSFAGGGGASSGLAAAMRSLGLNRDPDIAINHDPEAIAMHEVNHPGTTHYCEDVWKVDPVEVTGGKRVGLMWASPTCSHFSKAKGTALDASSIKIRGLCWNVVRWAAAVHIDVICMENVEEFVKFGPLYRQHTGGCSNEYATRNGKRLAKVAEGLRGTKSVRKIAKALKGVPLNRALKGEPICKSECKIHKPIKEREGELFDAFISRLERLGYVVEWKILKACDYGAPTTRKRWFLVARRDGKPIVWPKPTHGTVGSGLLPYRTAAECIDWEIQTRSIFGRERPLADKTLARIARGVEKFVLQAAKPFIVPVSYGDKGGTDLRVNDVDEPLPTVCGSRGGHAVVAPTLVRTAHGDVDASGKRRGLGAHSIEEPIGTVCAGGGDFALASPLLLRAKTYGGGGNDAKPANEPLTTVTASKRGEHAIATPVLVRTDMHQSNADCAYSPEDPLRTVTTGGSHAIAVPYLVHRSNGERAEVKHADGSVSPGQAPRVYDINEPHPTVVGQGIKTALSLAYLVKNNGGNNDRAGSAMGQFVEEPIDTIACRDQKSLTVCHLTRYNGERRPGETRGAELAEPLPTQDTSNRFGLTVSHLTKLRGTSDAHIDASSQSLDEPMPTISAGGTHLAKVSAYLVRYNGEGDAETIEKPMGASTTRDRFGLVEVTLAKDVCDKALRVAKFLGYDAPLILILNDEQWVLVDIGMRMLEPRELFNANSFPEDYQIERDAKGNPFTKTAQIRMCGNVVPPKIAEALATAQLEAA